MRPLALLGPVCVLGVLGCGRGTPVRVEDRNLGFVALFPGQPRLHKFSESTPFGSMAWFSTTYETPGRLDRSFYVNVGNLPPGDRGGTTATAVLATMRGFLEQRIGRIEAAPLPPARGAGFHYKARLLNGGYVEGLAILRRGRLHHAQATVSKPEDPELKAFLGSFQTLP